MYLRQSTTQTISIGPFLDRTDGATSEAALTLANTDIRLSKGGGAFVDRNSAAAVSIRGDGWYSFDLDATDTDTVGELYIQVDVTAALPVFTRYFVLEEAVYDSLFASGAAGVGGATASEVYTEFTTGANADAFKADVSALATSAEVSAVDTKIDVIDGEVGDVLVDTSTTIPAVLTILDGKADTISSNVDAILVDTDTTIPATLATLAVQASADSIQTIVNAIVNDTDVSIPALIAALEAKVDTVDTVVDAVQAKTDQLTFTDGSNVDANVQKINDVTITGNGQSGTEFSV